MDTNTGMAGTDLTTGAMKEETPDTMERLGARAQGAMNRVSAVASSAAERLGATSRQLREAKDEYVDTARGYIKEHPFTAIGIALAAGFLISRLTR